MIDLKSRTHIPKTTVSRTCYHDAGEAFAKEYGVSFWWLSDISDHEEMAWVIKHHPDAADMANMPSRLIRAALGG